jgi:hypothetical protein
MTFTEYRYHSILADCDMVRVSAWDSQGGEHFALVPEGPGYAQRRERACGLIAASVDAGSDPGELFPFGKPMDKTGDPHASRH